MPVKYLATLFAGIILTGTVFAADITPPVTIHTQTPDTPDGNNGWYTSIVKFDLQATDLDSGVRRIFYRVDNGIWQNFAFDNNLNLAPNPSFEDQNSLWQGPFTYVYDTYDPSFPSTSAKILSTTEGWSGINHSSNFAVAAPLSNMSASVSLKTENVQGSAYYKIYAVSNDGSGNQVTTLINQSSTLTGTNDWTKIYLNFVVTEPNAIGVYLDIGLEGQGTIWVDAVSLSNSTKSATGSFSVAKDNENHLIEYYSTDFAGNQETIKTVNFKQDMTPPSNWNTSGAFRGVVGPSDHHLYVFTNVEDETSGLSINTSEYQYFTDVNPGFGTFSDLMQCSSTWQPDSWANLTSSVNSDGDKLAYLLTPKTDFCNNDWKTCKTVKFFAEDMAGNTSYKDMCINGPWIKLRGKGAVRSNYIIDMVAESNDPNTDSLIETTGNTINYFSSEFNWKAKNTTSPLTRSYNDYKQMILEPTTITTLPTVTGKYIVDGSLTLTSQNIPNTYDTAVFDQIIFVEGDLTVNSDLEISNQSTVLFIVRGNVNISKDIEILKAAIITDGTFNTAFDAEEGQMSKTLKLYGIYHANKFNFQRTLQGTNNADTPSEDFLFEPKYLVQLKKLFGESRVKWLSVE